MSNTLADYLRSMEPRACSDSIKWAETQPDAPTAWAACVRGDWILWFFAQTGGDLRQLVLAACACARLSLVRVPAGEDRPRLAIETAEAWARGEASVAKVRAAADAAFAAFAAAAAADHAGFAAYADAAFAAAYAAFAAYYDDYAASAVAAAAAADHAGFAAYDAAGRGAAGQAARDAVLRQCADLCRTMLPMPEVLT